MLKIRALNRESSSDEDFPVIRREAQEEIALELYNQALRLQSAEKIIEAEQILQSLINENIPQLENNGPLPHSMSTIKYSCHLNIGNINIKKGEPNTALDNYLSASELDTTDVTLWYKIGTLAIKQNRFRQAAYALAKGLECSESHWPCLDQIISLLYAMRDMVSCLLYIGRALNLDPYYTKGLVLREQIFKDNPATLTYYQQYNPDYIWEPPLSIDIEEEEKILLLEKEQILCDQITVAEKAVGPKSLQTIPLLKPLHTFTWVSLGSVVINLHQHITDNNMSHLTMIDVNKCMISKEKEIDAETTIELDVEEKLAEVSSPDGKTEVMIVDEEKTAAEIIVERRPSQNSETNNDGMESTPVQTDNDEPPPMEQDGEDPDDNNDSKMDKNRSLSKANKRKRDLLSDLQIWGWHSKRKSAKKGKCDKDFTVEDALNRIIPSHLLKNKIGEERYNQFEDSMNTMDIYNMYVENRHVNILSPIHSPKSEHCEEYFGTDREKEDVSNLWSSERQYCDSIVLIKDFVLSLSKYWHTRWPKELVPMYIEAYRMYREHFDHPDPFSGDFTFEEMRDDALATLLYGELLNFSSTKAESRTIHFTSLGFIQAISGWQENWQDEFSSFFIRVYWLRSHIFRKEGNNDLAIRALELVQEVITENEQVSEKYFLHLPNCYKCSFITKDITSKILKHLDMITSLNCLEELYNAEKYQEVAEILKLTFTSSGSHPTCGRMGRPAQLAMLLHSLWYTNLGDCFVWTEECLYEALGQFLKPSTDASKWEKVVEKCLAFLQEIIKTETVSVIDMVSEDKRARLVETLARIVSKQLNAENSTRIPLGCITPWILLHYILVREEHRQQAGKIVCHVKSDKNGSYNSIAENQSDDVPPSVAILFSAHEFLGPKGWCLTNTGELLHFILDTILDRLDTPILEPLREKIDIHIEQSMFCLYQHPSKKNKISRHLADHNVDPLSLTWERAFQLFEFYGPDCLPEFNSYKNASISSDLEQLLQRIIALIPSECEPQPSMPKLNEFIQGKTTELPEPINFPNKVRSIYYLIGDYYFKQREFGPCVKYFMMDLCINPTRVDSWACIALSYLSQLENKLNYCKKLRSEMEFLDKANCTQITFRKALDLANDHIMLWIEFGSFEYMAHSFCSRVMKSESDTLSMEKFEYLENQKNNYLESSGRSFEKAIKLYQPDESEADERWLQYYILGKVAEKKQKEPNDYLQYYITAGKLLHENNATYPDKINYHNPQHLSVEALEIYYRINASILKYLELHEGKDIPNSVGTLFKHNLENSSFPKKNLVKESAVPTELSADNAKIINLPPPDDKVAAASATKIEKLKTEDIGKEVKKCVGEMLGKVEHIVREQQKVVETKPTASGEPADVIMISDSDDEQMNGFSEIKVADDATEVAKTQDESKPENNSVELDKVLGTEGKDVQELLDKMMEETMKKTEEQAELDSDTSVTSKPAVEVKTEIKVATTETKPKSGSETTDDIRTSVDDSTSSPSSSSSSSSSSDSDSDDDSSSSCTSSSSEVASGNISNNETLALIDRCIIGLEQCIIRLPQNYKALYRLAHLYYNYKARRDLNKCKQLLLGEYTCKGGIVITGLFSDRKIQNFFNGIWRIPSSEIDRPGSLSAHMSRCINLLLQVLRATNDNKTLLDLSMQFRKTPDPDKIYIKDSERLQFADQAMAMCIQSLRSQIQNVPNMSDLAVQKLLHEIFRSYQRVQKHEANREATFSSMLTEAYKRWKKDKIADNVNVLDLATKFCQQNRLAEKQKRQMQNQPAMLRGAIITSNPPVHPTPSAVGPPAQPPLKRPGMGRPRGRPPLPKIPGQPRVPRARTSNSASNPYSWQKNMFDQNASYNYLRHYQEELIKQYSQSLSLSQLTQLSQYFTQNQFNTLAQNQLATQFLAGQNPLLNNPNLLKQMAAGQFMPSQMGDAGKHLKKKLSSDKLPGMTSASSGLTVEPLTNYAAMAQKSSGYSKKNLPCTITSPSQSTTITKVKTTIPSNVFNMKMPHSLSVSNVMKPYVSKPEETISHTVTSLPQPPATCKVKTMYTPTGFKSNYTGGINYSAADMTKNKGTAATKTSTSLQQIFKEPSIAKALSTSHPKSIDKTANLLMKDRPNISITPVLPSSIPLITTSSFISPVQTSPGKTLQEKLADKQKQQLSKHLARNIEAEIIHRDIISNVKKPVNISSIPSPLSMTKAGSIKFPLESGISISQIAVAKPYKTGDALNLQHASKIAAVSKSTPDVSQPPKQPISMNLIKQPERKHSSDDDVIFLD